MSYHVQQALDVFHETAALFNESEALVVSYETDDTKGLTYSERKERMARFTRAYILLQESLTQSIASSRELVSLLTMEEVKELFDRLESDVVTARSFLTENQLKVIS